MKRSKSYRAAAERVDRARLYPPLEAIRLAKETSPTAFDATVEVALRLGVDPRKADQMVRGTVNLPHGTGKTARVLVFAGSPSLHDIPALLDDVLAKVHDLNGGPLSDDVAIVALEYPGPAGGVR
jgi:large subunit ribosomal protein L1